MDDLRWSLVVLGVILIIGIYAWDRIRRRRSSQSTEVLDRADEDLLERMVIGQEPVDDSSVKEALEELGEMRGERVVSEQEPDLEDLRSVVPGADADKVRPEDRQGPTEVAEETATDYETEVEKEEIVSRPTEDLIIVLNVIAESDQNFAGADVREALEDLDLRHGDMRVFHHFGVGDMSVDVPVFSVANILEPGSFDLDHMEKMSTPGLCMFMRLPGPLDGRVAFELMLSTGQRLAERLGGKFCDDTRNVLNTERIGGIRERIFQHQRRQLAVVE